MISRRNLKRLKSITPVAVLALALILVCMALFGDESYVRLQAMQIELEKQRGDNDNMREYLHTLKKDVIGLKRDDRMLEKTARNELGMQRDNELMIIFDESR